ncbi:MAG: dienelactone hydrolase family protein [Phenylobacterium sp.]|uniref:dienelactone hydrolase family protein n=1 Tax=Phenylobacterium sp. TaxID=1871053 RepID=UPI001A53CAA5|nr:dienelactone hydrolase family protein [Phenylobacterium sp.]MBL8555716.1 dienelactone hydrolase family protein [Phenylobacterium sp.]
MGETVQVASPVDGFRFDTYRAAPTEARRGGLVICHAIWGVTPHLRDLADTFAAIGYEVLLPSLFDRSRRGFAERDTDPALQTRQNGMAQASGWGVAVLDAVQGAIDALAPPVFAMGFCFGGNVAWLAASRCGGLAAVSAFYGGQIATFLDDTPKIPTILHLGKTDPLIPPADVEAIRAAHPDLPVFVYEAGHAFMAPNGFHEDSARLARLRTLQLFARSGGARGEA